MLTIGLALPIGITEVTSYRDVLLWSPGKRLQARGQVAEERVKVVRHRRARLVALVWHTLKLHAGRVSP